MNITGMSLQASESSAPISFSLRDADPRAQYVVRAVTGLDPEDITPKFTGSSLVSGSRLYDFSKQSREVVMRIVLRPRFNLNESYSDARTALYKLISSTRTGLVRLTLTAGPDMVGFLLGFISKVEATTFEQTPEVQLTLSCDDPMIRGVTPVVYPGPSIATEDVIGVIDSVSDAPHGMAFQVTFTSTVATFTLQDSTSFPEWRFRVIPTGGFLAGDELYCSSEYASKYLYMIRSGVTTHLMDKIEPTSVWPTVYPGTNVYYIYELTDGLPHFDWNVIQFLPAYWGV
jgi:hypothetical protein